MLLLLFHLFAGLLTGAIFGVQTLLVLALLVLIEMACGILVSGVSSGVIWGVGTEIVLQFGYLGGVYLRSAFERFGLATSRGT
jgi:hypothetical protein